ncbi:M16 family metallopeptidase [Hwanghaeella sp.]|uniref:M16 family metallopeptidase n=1 Tax=Hwanghaeella sp. TaxID=2605943 RepID=UPI003CCBFD2E
MQRLSIYWAAFAAILIIWTAPAKAIEIQEVISPGGVKAWLVEDDTADLVSMDFLFAGGESLDPAGKEGLAELVSSLLDEGAGDLDSQAYQRILNDKSIGIGFSAGRDSFSGSFMALNRYRDEAVRLLRLALTAPRFDEDAVERIRGQILINLKRRETSPNAKAGAALVKALYGDDPYGRPGGGTIDGIQAVTVADMRDFVARTLTRDKLIIGVVGNITADELKPMLDDIFGGLPEKGDVPVLAPVKASADGGVIVIEQDVPQSVVTMAQPVDIDRNDPDYYAAYLVTHILGGGGFSSRLTEEVREKRGLAYSTYAALQDSKRSALITAGVSTRNDGVAESVEIIRREWTKMRDRGVTAEELKNAKTYLTGSYPLRFTTTGQIAGALAGIQYYDLGIDYIDKRNGYLEAVTLEQANRVAKQLFDPDALTIVVVGKPVGLAATRPVPDIGG